MKNTLSDINFREFRKEVLWMVVWVSIRVVDGMLAEASIRELQKMEKEDRIRRFFHPFVLIKWWK